MVDEIVNSDLALSSEGIPVSNFPSTSKRRVIGSRCVVWGCSTLSAEGCGMFLWPKDDRLASAWTKCVQNTRADFKGPGYPGSKNPVICGKHFNITCFTKSCVLKREMGFKAGMRLEQDAIPSIFPKPLKRQSTAPLAISSPNVSPKKFKRKSGGAYVKRERKRVITELMKNAEYISTTPAATDDIAEPVVIPDNDMFSSVGMQTDDKTLVDIQESKKKVRFVRSKDFEKKIHIVNSVEMSCATALDDGVWKLDSVLGFEGKMNNVLYAGKTSLLGGTKDVIFFGGDIQDFKADMLQHRDSKQYVEWSLDASAVILRDRFPDANIWVIRPSIMCRNIISVYSNFVNCNEVGTPLLMTELKALQHLKLLLGNCKLILNENSKNMSCETDEMRSESVCLASSAASDIGQSLPIILIGFSKGCVVVNQIVYELDNAIKDAEYKDFVSRISEIYWLDGGHSGSMNTWVTDQMVLESLANHGAKLFTHTTPYQVKDEMRSWIGKEHKKFVKRLLRLGVKVNDKLHFANERRSIKYHLKILKKF